MLSEMFSSEGISPPRREPAHNGTPLKDAENQPRRMSGPVPSPVAGVKRPAPAPSLLPAFEYSSSPPLPRPAKRVARHSPSKPSSARVNTLDHLEEKRKYPTPVPTSSTGLIPSSPPLLPTDPATRPQLPRTISALTERAPLASVPTVELDRTGEPLLLGRSGKSAHYQLSANKLISRVHVRAAYVPAAPPDQPAKVEIVCTGWNGLRAHCQGRKWELSKDDSFVSHSRDADIMVDVQDTRVLLRWPQLQQGAPTPESEQASAPESEGSPRRGRAGRSPRSSPLRPSAGRLQSPVSPTPLARAPDQGSPLARRSVTSQAPLIQIWEDPRSDEDEPPAETQPTQSTQRLTQPLGTNLTVPQEPLPEEELYSDQDEENDPIVHSFGPFGDNLLPRMQNINTAASPARTPSPSAGRAATAAAASLAQAEPGHPREPSPYVRKTAMPQLDEAEGGHHDDDDDDDDNDNHVAAAATTTSIEGDTAHAIINHVANQLAFARVASTPLSTILSNLPAELRTVGVGATGQPVDGGLSLEQLRALIHGAACVGEVPRAGKDAAGKALESEYYYVPELDVDAARRDAVVEGLRKPGLRNCRKQHKVRPRFCSPLALLSRRGVPVLT